MKSLKDLALVLKREHPQYQNMDDYTLALRAKERYPEKYADYVDDRLLTLFTGPSGDLPTLNSNFTNIDSSTALQSANFQKKFDALLDYYQPQRGRFSSWWQSKKAESRIHLQKLINEEEQLVIEQGIMIENAVLSQRRNKAEFEMFLRQNAFVLIELQAKVELINAALKQGLPVEEYVELRTEELRKTLGTQEQWELSRIRLSERAGEMEQDQEHADRIELSGRNLIRKLNHELLEKRMQLNQLANTQADPVLKSQIENDLKEYISGLEKEIRGRQARYIQAQGWEDDIGDS